MVQASSIPGSSSQLSRADTDPQKKTEAAKIQATWSQWSHKPSEAEIKRAALLAWEGYLTSVEYLEIRNKSISDIPLEHIEKLASIVTRGVDISNMTHNKQLGSILASVKSPELRLRYMDQSDTETRALVTAMRDWVQGVVLRSVILDMEELTQYEGRGYCRELGVAGDMMTRYGERLRRWAADKGWRVTQDDGCLLVMKK